MTNRLRKIVNLYRYFWMDSDLKKQIRRGFWIWYDCFGGAWNGFCDLLGILFAWPILILAMIWRYTGRVVIETYKRDDEYFARLAKILEDRK